MNKRQNTALGETLPPRVRLKQMIHNADEAELDKIIEAIYSVVQAKECEADVSLLQITRA